MHRGPFLQLVMLALVLENCLALDNGLALTPPMGWRTEERFGCTTDCNTYPDDCISEQLVKSTAQVMYQRYAALGYRYLMLDDCWQARLRDAQGRLAPDPKRFPSGMRALADYVHSRGLKLGLRLSTGDFTCNGFPGSRGHLQTDAGTLAEWGVDMLTLDGCNTTDSHALDSAYPEMQRHLNQTGRHILFECLWPMYLQKIGRQVDWAAVARTCNTWRMYDKDLIDSWESLHDNLKYFGDNLREVMNYTGPGSWHNPGPLLVGDFGLSENQQRMHMGLWSVSAAPLFVSADLRKVTASADDILRNARALRVSQDALRIMGLQKSITGQVRVWIRPINPKGSYALLFLYTNISGGPSKVSVKLQDLGLTTAAAYNFTEAFSGKSFGVQKPWYTFNCEVNPTGALLILAEALP